MLNSWLRRTAENQGNAEQLAKKDSEKDSSANGHLLPAEKSQAAAGSNVCSYLNELQRHQ